MYVYVTCYLNNNFYFGDEGIVQVYIATNNLATISEKILTFGGHLGSFGPQSHFET